MRKEKLLLYLLMITGLFLIAQAVWGQSLSVEAAVEKTQAYVGESFIYQITVGGSNNPGEPELSGFADFDVVFLGGRNNSSVSISIINGRQKTVETQSYIFQYQLSPRRSGTLTIPAVMIKAGGRSLMTNSIRINAKEPAEVDDYKLRINLTKSSCYVGEPVVLMLTWYIGSSVDDISFNIPLFNDSRFIIENFTETKKNSSKYYNFQVSGKEYEFQYPSSKSTFRGKKYNTLVLKKVLIPRSSGSLSLGKATVQFSGVSGYRKVRDFWGQIQQKEVYEKLIIPSNSLRLNVNEVPKENKPANYSGLIGEKYKLDVSATPLDIRVGDPITVTISLSGPAYLSDAKLPPLGSIKVLSDSFKIPSDRAPGKMTGNKKVFTQTLRALGVDVTEIPSFTVSYFNTKSGRYETAASKAIPLEVDASEIKTFLDLEGMEPVDMKSELEVWTEGIAHNYEGFEILTDQTLNMGRSFSNPLLILLMILPVVVFIVLLYFTRFSHLIKVSDADKRSKKAHYHLIATLTKIRESGNEPGVHKTLLKEVNKYIGAKLNLKSEALTFQDVESALAAHGVSRGILDDLKEVYRECEAGHYAGKALLDAGIADLCDLTGKTVQEIERSFK